MTIFFSCHLEYLECRYRFSLLGHLRHIEEKQLLFLAQHVSRRMKYGVYNTMVLSEDLARQITQKYVFQVDLSLCFFSAS